MKLPPALPRPRSRLARRLSLGAFLIALALFCHVLVNMANAPAIVAAPPTSNFPLGQTNPPPKELLLDITKDDSAPLPDSNADDVEAEADAIDNGTNDTDAGNALPPPSVPEKAPEKAPETEHNMEPVTAPVTVSSTTPEEDEESIANTKEEEDLGVITRGRLRKLRKEADPGSPFAAGGSEDEDEGACLSKVFYDKPMKTGSSAVLTALEYWLSLYGEKSLVCNLRSCGDYARKLCDGAADDVHLIDHIFANVSTALCLKQRGYYSVTSIRDPVARWNSAYLFNLWKKGTHYGTSYKASHAEFVAHMPNCGLLKYYDRGAGHCTGDVNGAEFQGRVAAILERFDEVIDLYGEALTDLHKRLLPYMTKENVTKKQAEVKMGPIPDDLIKYEMALYKALQKKRLELVSDGNPERRLCKRPRIMKKA